MSDSLTRCNTSLVPPETKSGLLFVSHHITGWESVLPLWNSGRKSIYLICTETKFVLIMLVIKVVKGNQLVLKYHNPSNKTKQKPE